MTEAELDELVDAFHEAAGRKCIMRGRGPCDWPIDPHHAVTQNRIKWELRELGDELVALATCDPRAALGVCRRHHGRHHSRFQPIPRSLLPGRVEEFAADWGLERYLDRDYA